MIKKPNAKINLGLRVMGTRSDGFHDIETVFLPFFGLCDNLEIVRGGNFCSTVDDLFAKYGGRAVRQGISPDRKCLISVAGEGGIDWKPLMDHTARIYRIMEEELKLPPVRIILEKNIPAGAGLGGGSSDCAFALKMMVEMFELNFDEKTMLNYASRIGSDCAFFLQNRPMLGQGRGDVLTPIDIPQLDDYEIQVLVPTEIRLDTAQIYKDYDAKVDSSKPRAMMSLREAVTHPIEEWKDLVVNDFEKIVFERHPQLAEIKQSLYDNGALYASMSGTGSAIYGVFPKQ